MTDVQPAAAPAPAPTKGQGGAATSSSPAAAAPAAQKPSLRTGQRVILQNLEKAPELNGHRGVVVRWREDVGRYAVRVAGKEMAIKPANLKPEGGAEEAARFAKKFSNTEGTMYNPIVYARVPGAGPKMTQWIGQVKAGRRVMVRVEQSSTWDDAPIPLWFGDQGFVHASPVDVALLIGDVGADPEEWPRALARALQHFPAAAGRLRNVRRGSDLVWQIVLNNAGVPFTTASVPPCGLPSAEELQLVCNDEQCGFFDIGASSSEKDADEPLLRMKLTYEEGTSRGMLGISFHHALCDISGIAALLRWLHRELDPTDPVPDAQPCHKRELAQEVLDRTPTATDEEAAGFAKFWPQWPRALERWCFLARRLRSGMRGRPDGAATLTFQVPAATLSLLKQDAESGGAEKASSFEALVSYLGLQLLRLGRRGRRALITKDYRAALEAASPGSGLEHLFGNVVTHGVSFELPDVADAEQVPLAEACLNMREAIDAVDLAYVNWHRRQDHYRGLPNLFGGLCCNTWGRALADLSFIETYAIGMRSIDERAANMAFPLDTAYLQVLPLPSGAHRVLLTLPVTEATALLKELSPSHFELPHVSEMRTHAFKVPLPSQVVDVLNPAVETHHLFARIACIGDSLTACGYPKYLQALFDRAGLRVQVRNFGVSGTTAQRFSDQPYWDERKLDDALQWRPHLVVATFGSNDSKSGVWDPPAFAKEYKELCAQFLERNPRPRVYLLVPPPLFEQDAYEMQQDVVNQELPVVIPQVAAAAQSHINSPLEEHAKRARRAVPPEMLARVGVIDAFTAFGGAQLRRRSYIAEDGVHPNERGTRLLATTVFAEIRQEVARLLRAWAQAAAVVPPDPLGL